MPTKQRINGKSWLVMASALSLASCDNSTPVEDERALAEAEATALTAERTEQQAATGLETRTKTTEELLAESEEIMRQSREARDWVDANPVR